MVQTIAEFLFEEGREKGRIAGCAEEQLWTYRAILRTLHLHCYGDWPCENEKMESGTFSSYQLQNHVENIVQQCLTKGKLAVQGDCAALLKVVEDRIREQGIVSGREEGRLEGRLLAYRDTIKRILTARFGLLPGSVVKRIEEATVLEELHAEIGRCLIIAKPEDLSL